MKNNFFTLIVLTVCSSCTKTIHNNTSMPRSNMEKNKVYMKEGVILNVRPQTGKIKIRDSVLFFDKSCIFVGFGKEINYSVVYPEFNPVNLPVPVKMDFYKSKGLYLFAQIEFADPTIPKSNVPFWVTKMPDLVFVNFEHIKLGNLEFLERLNLKHLVLNDVEFSDRQAVINSISKIKTLEFLISDDVFTQSEMDIIQTQLPNLAILTTALYDKKAKAEGLSYPYSSYGGQ